MAKQQDPLKAIRAGIAAAKQLTEAEQTLRERHVALSKERQHVAGADPSLDEVLASMETLVDSKSKDWAESFAKHIVRHVGGHQRRGVADTTRMYHAPPELPRFGAGSVGLTVEDLVGLDPQRIKAQLAGIIRQSGARFGLAAKDRGVKLAELDKEISETEAAHTALVDGAGEVGIVLSLLKPVATKREKELELQAREAELEEARSKAAARGEEHLVAPAYVSGMGVGPA